MKNIILIPFILLIFSCVSNSNLIVKSDVNIGPNIGVILVSVTKNNGSDAWFYYKKRGTKEAIRMDAVGIFNDADINLSEEKKRGRLLAIKAEPGIYDLTGWDMYVYTYPNSTKYIGPKEFEPIEFTIKEGEITYLGNLHLDAIVSKNFFGAKIPFDATSKISDDSKRDLISLKEKYPNISKWPLTKHILNEKKWLVE